MPATSPETDLSFRKERVASALSLMAEALKILDELEDAPELAARLDEIIERLKERAGAPAGLGRGPGLIGPFWSEFPRNWAEP